MIIIIIVMIIIINNKNYDYSLLIIKIIFIKSLDNTARKTSSGDCLIREVLFKFQKEIIPFLQILPTGSLG